MSPGRAADRPAYRDGRHDFSADVAAVKPCAFDAPLCGWGLDREPSRRLGVGNLLAGRRPAWDGEAVFERFAREVTPAVADGRSCRVIAKLFRVSPASVVKWSQRHRSTGSAAAKPMGGVRRAVLADHRAWLLERIREQPDLTLQALRTELAGRGVTVSLWAVWKLFASEGITFKKSLLPTEQLRSAVARKRERWKRLQQALDPKRLVFIDETWVKTNMVRLRGRAPRARRLHERVPHGHWKTMTFIAPCGQIASTRLAFWISR